MSVFSKLVRSVAPIASGVLGGVLGTGGSSGTSTIIVQPAPAPVQPSSPAPKKTEIPWSSPMIIVLLVVAGIGALLALVGLSRKLM